MLRRFNYATSRRAFSAAAATASVSSASMTTVNAAPVAIQRQAPLSEWIVGCPLVGHFATIGGCTATNLMFSPLGTVALIVLAFNVNYVGLKHLWYTAEFPMRDYVQDAALKQALRYLMLIALLLAGEGYFVEP